VSIEVVTPILGGSSQTRAIDKIDVIRAATVKGHLRFWWRALRGHEFVDARALWDNERALWGSAAGEDRGGRSAVEIHVAVTRAGGIDDGDVHPQRTPGAYALWPAREERKTKTPPAPRRIAGTQFRLTLVAPETLEQELRNTVRAWLLFGGYGSRTRRGLGSFGVVDAGTWLPASATPSAFQALFGRSIFASPGRAAVDTPWLASAALQIGHVVSQAATAWTTALGWLSEFRQGHGAAMGRRAREPGANGRPSISNWPEADKIRQLSRPRRGGRWAHTPRHNATWKTSTCRRSGPARSTPGPGCWRRSPRRARTSSPAGSQWSTTTR
jgi:CRISPR-associated protein Cmr1